MKAKKKIPVATEFSPLRSTPLAHLSLAGLPAANPSAAPSPPAPPTPSRSSYPLFPEPAGEVIVRKETSGRSGKTVLVLHGWSAAWSEEALRELARQARQACGCGGTLRAGEVELQGSDSARVRRFLESLGFRVRGV